MNVYIPTREEIANRLQMIADVVRHAKTLSEVESELTDEQWRLIADLFPHDPRSG